MTSVKIPGQTRGFQITGGPWTPQIVGLGLYGHLQKTDPNLQKQPLSVPRHACWFSFSGLGFGISTSSARTFLPRQLYCRGLNNDQWFWFHVSDISIISFTCVGLSHHCKCVYIGNYAGPYGSWAFQRNGTMTQEKARRPYLNSQKAGQLSRTLPHC